MYQTVLSKIKKVGITGVHKASGLEFLAELRQLMSLAKVRMYLKYILQLFQVLDFLIG